MEKKKNWHLVHEGYEIVDGSHTYDSEKLEVQQVGKSHQPDGQRPQVRSCQHSPKVRARLESTKEGLAKEGGGAFGHEFCIL